MNSAARIAAISGMFRRGLPFGTTVYVLPSPANHVAEAAMLAGMRVAFQTAGLWPFPDLMGKLARQAGPPTIPAGWPEIARHDAVRDHLADGIRSAPGGAAITEVALVSTLSAARADADIVARAPTRPGAAKQAFFEIKTGTFSEIRPNQRYVYALALVGGHVISRNSQLSIVGLEAGVPLPAMDFVFIDVPPDGAYQPALVLASEVDRAASIAQIMAYVGAAEARR